jgi:signal transduction histidine kinase
MLIFQMVRELLFNVVKHAAVPRATVQLRHEELPQIGPAYCIDVIDEGPGFDPEPVVGGERVSPGRGLRHMRERLSLIGGRLEIIAPPGEGTRATIIAPLATAG